MLYRCATTAGHNDLYDSDLVVRRRGVDVDDKIRIVRRRCREKCRVALSEDRLLEDKLYLKALADGIERKPGATDDKVNVWAYFLSPKVF